MKQNARKNRKEGDIIFYRTDSGSRRVNVKRILENSVLRKKLLDGAKEFLIAIGRYT